MYNVLILNYRTQHTSYQWQRYGWVDTQPLIYCSDIEWNKMWEQSVMFIVMWWTPMVPGLSWCYMWCPDRNTMMVSVMCEHIEASHHLFTDSFEKQCALSYLFSSWFPNVFFVHLCFVWLVVFSPCSCQQVDQLSFLRVTITCLLWSLHE